MNPEQLAQKYTGNVVDAYEINRVRSEKWKFEQESISSMLLEVKRTLGGLSTVLDAPVGTGRFLELYRNLGIAATGLDISSGMLKVAAAKKLPGELIEGSLFNYDFKNRVFDCTVCVRFLNWMVFENASRIIRKMVRLSERYVVFTVSACENRSYTRPNGAIFHDLRRLEDLLFDELKLQPLYSTTRPIGEDSGSFILMLRLP